MLKKNKIFLRVCLCFFESDTVKSNCPVQIFRKMIKYSKIEYRLLVYHTSLTVFLDILIIIIIIIIIIKKKALKMKKKKKALKMTS